MRHPPAHRAQRSTAVALLLVLALGCDSDVAGPVMPAAGDGAFYPLSIGTRWEYRNARTVRFIAADGTDARAPLEFRASSTRAIVARETIAGLEWSVEEERIVVEGAADTVVAWQRYREDATGLYRADLPTHVPPGGSAGVDSVTASRRLAYPRRVGTTWPLRAGDPGATGTLVAAETVATPLGPVNVFSVWYDVPGMGPRDRRVARYSTCGIVGTEVHIEVDAIDVDTGEQIRVVSTETAEIESVAPPCRRLASRDEEVTRRGRVTGARPAPALR